MDEGDDEQEQEERTEEQSEEAKEEALEAQVAVYLMSLMKIKTSSSILNENFAVMDDNWIYDMCECARGLMCS